MHFLELMVLLLLLSLVEYAVDKKRWEIPATPLIWGYITTRLKLKASFHRKAAVEAICKEQRDTLFNKCVQCVTLTG